MIEILATIAAGLLLLVGAAFALVGAVGVLRFPDVFTRMHAASKAGTLGSGFCLLAVAVTADGFDVATRAIAAVFFFILTAPISAHLLARAALIAGYEPVGDHRPFKTKGSIAADRPNEGQSGQDQSAS